VHKKFISLHKKQQLLYNPEENDHWNAIGIIIGRKTFIMTMPFSPLVFEMDLNEFQLLQDFSNKCYLATMTMCPPCPSASALLVVAILFTCLL